MKMQMSEEKKSINRRTLLKTMVGGTAVLLVNGTAAQRLFAQESSVKPGDVLVFERGERSGQPITPDALTVGGEPLVANAMDPVSGTVRRGRYDRVVLIRLDPDEYDADTAPNTVEGVSAYSAVCTHQGCTVNRATTFRGQWSLLCPCHNTIYDASDGGTVVEGPAPRALAVLPIELGEAHTLTVAATFVGSLG